MVSKLLLVAGFVGVGLGPGQVQGLKELPRYCTKYTCVSGNETVELTCGGTGEKISEVYFASYGDPSGTCPKGVFDDWAKNESLVKDSLKEKEGCAATDARKVVEDLCLKKPSCMVNLVEAFLETDPGLSSCLNKKEKWRMEAHVKCSDVFDVFSVLISGIVATVGLGLGASLELHMIKNVFKEHKRAIILGFALQNGWMSFLGFLLALSLDVSNLTKLSIILCGTCPGGTTSNIMTYFAKGSLSLSMVMSALSTMFALITLPTLTAFYAKVGLGLNQAEVEIPVMSIMTALVIAVIPALIGVWIRHRSEAIAKKVERFGSALGAAFLVAAFVFGVKQNPELMQISRYPNSYLGAIIFQPVGCLVGYFAAKLLRIPAAEARAVSLETGVQNYTIAMSLISLSFSGCQRVEALTFPLICSMFYVVNSLWITGLLRFLSRYDGPPSGKIVPHDANNEK